MTKWIKKLSDSVHAMKLQASSQQNIRENSRDNSRYNNRNPQERRTFTKIGRSYEDVLEELVDGKLLNLIENWQPPPVKGPCWDDNAYRKYYQRKIGHTMKNCERLKHEIQNLIDNGKLIIDGVSCTCSFLASIP